MYPIALICWLPLSAERVASLPQVFETSDCPPVPNPILESGLTQSFSWLASMPILALLWLVVFPILFRYYYVTVRLQRGRWANQSFPLVSTKERTAVLSISNHRVKRGRSYGNENEIQFSVGLHSEADLGEGRVPVCCQLDFIRVECLSRWRGPIASFVAPVGRIVMKCFLRTKENRKIAALNCCVSALPLPGKGNSLQLPTRNSTARQGYLWRL